MKKLTLILSAGCLGFAAPAAIFTSDTAIPAGSTNYDGDDIVVIGCTVTIDGPHTFSDVVIIEDGVITHSPITNTTSVGLDLTVLNNVVIETGSAIVADGLGFAAGTGPGAGGSGLYQAPLGLSYADGGGGGYGGNGAPGIGGAPGGVADGLLLNPIAAGSGGGKGFGLGGAGGGIVNLTIGEALVLDGQITADGGTGLSPASGGGSGGGISITAPSVSGAGTISANGGAGEPMEGGGGGGGRVSLSITTNDFTGAITAYGGAGDVTGGAGTVYIKTAEPSGDLILIDNGGSSGTNTPLALPSLVNLTIRGGAIVTCFGDEDNFSVANLVIESNSWFSSPGRVSMHVEASNVTIQDGGGINFAAAGQGEGEQLGLGLTETVGGIVYGGGGGHGGPGGSAIGAAGGGAFESVTEPDNSGGSGGGSDGALGGAGLGGGAIVMSAAHVSLDGLITANGGNGLREDSGGGAGGSVWLTAQVLTGNGSITADGGDAGSPGGGGGGGGRIAISLATNEFSGTISAHGGVGYMNGGAGTIFLAASSSPPSLLLLDNNGLTGPETPLTELPESVNLILTNSGSASGEFNALLETLYIASNCVLVASNEGSITAQSLVIESNGELSANMVVNDFPLGPTGGTLVSQGNITTGGGGGNRGYGGASAFGAPGGSPAEEEFSGSGAGSGGNKGGAGGGTVELKVEGTALVNGKLSVDGAPGIVAGSGGGAGGTVSLSVGTLTGNGVISANGGPGQLPWGGGGGGGLINTVIESSNLFEGAMTAYGGAGATGGGAGIVMVRTNEGMTQITIDNNGLSGADTAVGSDGQGLQDFFALSILNGAIVVATEFESDCRELLIGSNAFLTVPTGIQYVSELNFPGDVTIQATGGIVYDYRGLAPTQGRAPGGGGGSNGGIGGNGAGGGIFVASPGQGSITQPSSPGTGGQYITSIPDSPGIGIGGYGGGVLVLSVEGVLSVGGKISANGQNGLTPGCGGGGGGSISINAGGLIGDGSITANGGAGNLPDGGGGGGGRIAIQTGSNQFSGVLSALGGAGFNPGGAGTIFTRSGNNGPEALIIDNGGATNGDTIFPAQLNNVNVTLQGGTRAVALPGGIFVNALFIRSNSFLLGTNTLLSIQAVSNITIAAGSGISLDALGGITGPSSGRSFVLADDNRTGGGGANAGNGGMGLGGAAPGQAIAGSVSEPQVMGGAGGGGLSGDFPLALGGGAVTLTVEGALEVDGVVSANGGSPTNGWGGGGAGGSVYIEGRSLSGTGIISAYGGSGGLPNGGGGGGGRVAVSVTSNAFSGIFSASGGAGYVAGGAGTVYLAAADSTPQLIIDNNGFVGAATPLSDLNPLSDLTVANGAIFEPLEAWTIENLAVESNALISLLSNRFEIIVLGNAQVQTTAAISANGGGWEADSGPGAGTSATNLTGSGGGYGGAGGASQGGAVGGQTNGTPEMPTAWGSGGGVSFGQVIGVSQGGGAINLNVGGTLTVYGAINANGNDATYPGSGGGAGGSVLLTTGTLAGNGLIAANGGAGQGNLGGGGGGGRIAIYAPTNHFAGQITAGGGSGFAAGEAGSVYASTNKTPEVVTLSDLPAIGINAPTAPMQVTLTWPGFAGATYQVQSSTDLIQWQPFGGAISGNAGAMNVTLTPSPAGQQQYFRLVLVN